MASSVRVKSGQSLLTLALPGLVLCLLGEVLKSWRGGEGRGNSLEESVFSFNYIGPKVGGNELRLSGLTSKMRLSTKSPPKLFPGV